MSNTNKPGARTRAKEKSDTGLVIVYTGDGKGKTTAALGMALRAVGRGWNVLMIQFGKGGWHYAELDSSQRLAPEFEIIPMGLGFYKILDDAHTQAEHQHAAQTALTYARDQMLSNKYDLLILDEIIGTLAAGFISLHDLFELLDAKPSDLTLVLTGRYAPQELIDRADLVTEMREIKHPYQKGILAQKGIDY